MVKSPGLADAAGISPPQPAQRLESATEVSRDLEAAGKTRSAPSPPVEPTISDGHGPVQLAIELVQGCITRQEIPVAVVGRYDGLPPLGVLAVFDQALDFWVKRAVDLRMIGSQLGELFYIPVRNKQVAPEGLLLAGMGEPGRFSREDLRLLMMNVVVALKGLGYNRFGTVLIGSRRGGLPIDRALRAMLEGIIDGFDRLPSSISRQLEVTLVEADPSRFVALRRSLENFSKENFSKTRDVPLLELSLSTREESCPISAERERLSPPPDLMPDRPMTRITISSAPSSAPNGLTASGAPGGLIFQYSALSDSAVIPVREREVASHFVEPLLRRLIEATLQEDQFGYGRLLVSYLLPEDFLRLLEEDMTLTLVLDSTSAIFPWEMAVLRGHRRTMSFFGPELRLTRQFRTLLSAAPGIPPPLNNRLKVLVIADPAPPPYNLDGARREGLTVVRALGLAKQAWGPALNLEVVVRIGAATSASRDGPVAELKKIPGHDDFIISEGNCEPLEILKLLLNDHFDVLHYAGHGVYDQAGRRKGWVFGEHSTLSATEIFKVPQVPRLVFANACHSSEIDASERPLSAATSQNFSLAEAFFERGIQNYIGAGWQVDDDQAVAFATLFYLQALGIHLKPQSLVELNDLVELNGLGELNVAAPPDTLDRLFIFESPRG